MTTRVFVFLAVLLSTGCAVDLGPERSPPAAEAAPPEDYVDFTDRHWHDHDHDHDDAGPIKADPHVRDSGADAAD